MSDSEEAAMRRGRAALTALTLILLTLLVAGPAQAGGPTSVLLVVPGTGQTASLYYSQADYEALAALVGAFGESASTGKVDRSGATHEFGTGVTLTWLIHDVQVWRVDRVYVGGVGGPWISTQATDGSGSIWETPVAWHTATDGQVLMSLLRRLGVSPDSTNADSGPVTGAVTGAGGDPGASIAPSPEAAPSAADSKQTAEPAEPGLLTSAGLVWGLAGLALGVLITVAALRLSSSSRPLIGRRETMEPGERGSSDAPDALDGPDSGPTWPSTDELSWPAPRR
jgi:hypothetical protein